MEAEMAEADRVAFEAGAEGLDTLYMTDLHGDLPALVRGVGAARAAGAALRALVLGGDIAPNRVALGLRDGDFPLRHQEVYEPGIADALRRRIETGARYRRDDEFGKPAVRYALDLSAEQLLRLDPVELNALLEVPSSFAFLRAQQLRFVDEALLPYVETLRAEGIACHVMLGNDDFVELEAPLLAADARGALRYLHGRVVPFGAGFIAGYSCVTSKPFRYRAWEREEAQIAADLEASLAGVPSERVVLCIHVPPHGTALDQLESGRYVGSHAVRALLARRRFALGLFGHVHESPLVSGRRYDRVGDTWLINPGGLHSEDVCGVLFDSAAPSRWRGLWREGPRQPG